MSTYAHSLWRPTKISDILDLGFEMDGEHPSGIRIKIPYHKVKEFDHYTDIDDNAYLFLWLNPCEHRGHQCASSIARYSRNFAALSYLLDGLHKKGYKLSVEGERYIPSTKEERDEYHNFMRQILNL